MYISKFILLKHDVNNKKYVIIYLYEERIILKITEVLYFKLKELYDRYKDNIIDENDIIFNDLKKNILFKMMLKNKLFVTNKKKYDETKKIFSIKTVYLHITLNCNLKCSYCYMKENLKSDCFINFSDLNLWIKDFKKIGIDTIVLTGGEPTLHKDFIKIVELIKQNGFNITVLTNGTNINVIPFNLIDTCIISMDLIGTGNRKGLDVNKLLIDIKNIDDKYRSKIFVRSVISRGDEDKLLITKEEIEKLEVQYIAEICIPNNVNEIKCIPDYNKLSCLLKEKNKFNILSECGACNSIISIDYNGDIYPCQSCMSSKLKLGNLNDKYWVESIYNSKVRRDFLKANVENIKECKECNLRYLCGGGCRAIAYNVYGSIYCKNYCLCSIYKDSINEMLDSIIFK